MHRPVNRVWMIVTDISKWLGMALVIVMAASVAVGTLGRYLFNRPIFGIDEYAGYMLMMIALLGATYYLRLGGHPRVDILLNRLPPRVAAWVNAFDDAISVVVVGLMFLTAVSIAQVSLVTGIKDMATETPLAPFQIMMVIGLALLGLEFIHQLTLSFKQASRKK